MGQRLRHLRPAPAAADAILEAVAELASSVGGMRSASTGATQTGAFGVDLVTVAELVGPCRLDTTRVDTLPARRIESGPGGSGH